MLIKRQKTQKNSETQWREQIKQGSRAIAKLKLYNKQIHFHDLPSEIPLTIEADTDAKYRNLKSKTHCFKIASRCLPEKLIEMGKLMNTNKTAYDSYLAQVDKIWEQHGKQCTITDIDRNYIQNNEIVLFENECLSPPITDITVQVKIIHTKRKSGAIIIHTIMLSDLLSEREIEESHQNHISENESKNKELQKTYNDLRRQIRLAEEEFKSIQNMTEARRSELTSNTHQIQDQIDALSESLLEHKESILNMENDKKAKQTELNHIQSYIENKREEADALDSRIEYLRSVESQVEQHVRRLNQELHYLEQTLDPVSRIQFRLRNIKWPEWANNRKTTILDKEHIYKLSEDCKKNGLTGLTADGDISGCYVLLNLDNHNKPYVGQAKNVFKRWKQHLDGNGSDVVHNDLEQGCTFSATVIPIAETPFMSLDSMEGALIKHFDAYTSGYNKTIGNGMYK